MGVVAALLVLDPRVGAAGRVVTFPAADGRTVSALLIEADQRPAPAVVLVPMLGRSKDDWEGVAQRLAESNITALAIDLPGGAVPDPAWSDDVRAAVSYLAARTGDIRPDAIGVAGASLGANLAVVAAAADPAIRSLALVSPSLDYRGVRIEAALRAYGSRPALFIASVRDPYAARSVRELTQDGAGPRDIRWSDAPAHGTVLLSRDPDLVRAILEWFQLTLG